jgi:hypothetical protein
VIHISKKKIYSKHLEKGRFYRHYDSNGGHPALIYYKNDKMFINQLNLQVKQVRQEQN